MRGYDRKWLHKDITNVIAAANAHLIAINTQVDAKQGLAEMNFALRVTDFGQLSGLLARLATVPNVLRIALVEHVQWPPQAAAAAAACLVGLLAAWVAPRLNIPRITVYVPAVTIMVPGVPAYRAVFYLSNGDITHAMSYGVSAAPPPPRWQAAPPCSSRSR